MFLCYFISKCFGRSHAYTLVRALWLRAHKNCAKVQKNTRISYFEIIKNEHLIAKNDILQSFVCKTRVTFSKKQEEIEKGSRRGFVEVL